jgi:PBP superfamily domain
MNWFRYESGFPCQVCYLGTLYLFGIDPIGNNHTSGSIRPTQLSDQLMALDYKKDKSWHELFLNLQINIPGILTKTLKFTGPVLADIFQGKITKWNDPQIKALNRGVNLPDGNIVVVHRSDGSGATYVWTSYLSTSFQIEDSSDMGLREKNPLEFASLSLSDKY